MWRRTVAPSQDVDMELEYAWVYWYLRWGLTPFSWATWAYSLKMARTSISLFQFVRVDRFVRGSIDVLLGGVTRSISLTYTCPLRKPSTGDLRVFESTASSPVERERPDLLVLS